MRKIVTGSSVKLWISANDTRRWAHKAGAYWPCSQLADKRLFVEYDSNGLCDLAIDGRYGDCDANELNAIVSDHLRGKLPPGNFMNLFIDNAKR